MCEEVLLPLLMSPGIALRGRRGYGGGCGGGQRRRRRSDGDVTRPFFVALGGAVDLEDQHVLLFVVVISSLHP